MSLTANKYRAELSWGESHRTNSNFALQPQHSNVLIIFLHFLLSPLNCRGYRMKFLNNNSYAAVRFTLLKCHFLQPWIVISENTVEMLIKFLLNDLLLNYILYFTLFSGWKLNLHIQRAGFQRWAPPSRSSFADFTFVVLLGSPIFTLNHFPPFSSSFQGLAQLLLMASFSFSSSPDLQSFIISVIQRAPSMLQHLFARVAHVLLEGCDPTKRLAAGWPLASVVWSPRVCANSRVACVTVDPISRGFILFPHTRCLRGSNKRGRNTWRLPVWWSNGDKKSAFHRGAALRAALILQQCPVCRSLSLCVSLADGDGVQDHLLPVCEDEACQRSAIYLSKPGSTEVCDACTEFSGTLCHHIWWVFVDLLLLSFQICLNQLCDSLLAFSILPSSSQRAGS